MKNLLVKYRPDIDGLRAIAVISVILFHAFPSKIPGGFIGVDIFFVISGYLISFIIISELGKKTFSFRDFYSRRIKRIFPALLIVLLGCMIFGWFSLLTGEYQQLSHHVFGASTFTNNFVLLQESGYFDNESETKPLLHLWSLSIEEQFYLVWPCILWIAFKQKWNLLFITSILCVISFVFHILNLAHSGSVTYAFYAPHLRAWELLVGSIAYQISPHHNSNRAWKGSIQSVLGLLLIFIGLLLINKDNKFPGWYALISPVLGTCLVIMNNPKNFLNKHLLSNKYIVGIGLISYPLYLWHWPLLSFARIIENQEPSLTLKISALVLTIVLSIMTYILVEKPFRKNKDENIKISVLVILMILVGFAGYTIKENNGISERKYAYPKIINKEDASTIHSIYKHYYPCENFIKNYPEQSNKCFQSKKNQKIDIAIIGDSHAEHIFPGMAEVLYNKNVTVFFKKTNLPFGEDKDFNAFYEYINSDANINKVFFTFYWKAKILNKNSKNKKELLNFSNEFTKTLNHIFSRNVNLYFLDDIPDFSFDPKQCKYYNRLSTSKNNCTENSSRFYNEYKNYMKIVKKITFKNNSIKILVINNYLCNEKNCFMAFNNELLYQDSNHLNLNGSRYIAKKMLENNQWIGR